MWKRRTLILLGVLLVLILSSISSFADDQQIVDENSSGIQPRFTHIIVLGNYLGIDTTGNVDISARLDTYDADSVELEVVLQQYINGHWIDIKSWNNTSVGTTVDLLKSYAVYSGYMYRTVATGYVYIGGSMVEEATCTSNVVEY